MILEAKQVLTRSLKDTKKKANRMEKRKDKCNHELLEFHEFKDKRNCFVHARD
jgi:hypothetical protein